DSNAALNTEEVPTIVLSDAADLALLSWCLTLGTESRVQISRLGSSRFLPYLGVSQSLLMDFIWTSLPPDSIMAEMERSTMTARVMVETTPERTVDEVMADIDLQHERRSAPLIRVSAPGRFFKEVVCDGWPDVSLCSAFEQESASAFVKTYTVELGRNSILTTELQCLAARDTDHAVRNKKLLVETDGNNFQQWRHCFTHLLQTGLTSANLAAYARTCKAIEGAGDIVANNLIEFLQTCSNLTDRDLLFSDAAPVFLGNNSRTFVSRLAGGTETENVAKISTHARHLRCLG
ncbi:unnamed protein product, partial [Symbiodinium microadriaticum]